MVGIVASARPATFQFEERARQELLRRGIPEAALVEIERAVTDVLLTDDLQRPSRGPMIDALEKFSGALERFAEMIAGGDEAHLHLLTSLRARLQAPRVVGSDRAFVLASVLRAPGQSGLELFLRIEEDIAALRSAVVQERAALEKEPPGIKGATKAEHALMMLVGNALAQHAPQLVNGNEKGLLCLTLGRLLTQLGMENDPRNLARRFVAQRSGK